MLRFSVQILALLAFSLAANAATYTVTTAASSGPGSLNDAIATANANPGHDLITFAIGSGTAVIPGPIELILDDVTIDGRTQPGFVGEPLIVLDGGGSDRSMFIHAPSLMTTEVRALWIRNYTWWGLRARSPVRLYGNWIGDPDALQFGAAVQLFPGASGSIIGGPLPGERNVIGGYDSGIDLQPVVTDVTISGNYIGIDPSGTTAWRNRNGIAVFSGERITIGGTVPGSGNVLSGNHQGAYIHGSDITVVGNLIGTDPSGLAAFPNEDGLYVTSSPVAAAGVTVSANVISGNRSVGLSMYGTNLAAINNLVGVTAAGTAALPNGLAGILVGNTSTEIDVGRPGAGNVISGTIARGQGDGGWGILVTRATGPVRIRGNRIGLAAVTDTPVPNRLAGINIVGSSGVFVGGPLPADANRIEHNLGDGIQIGSFTPTTGNVIEGNSIRANGGTGVVLSGFRTVPNVIRRNAIHDNGGLGIDLGMDGVTANDPLDSDSGPNERQNAPELEHAVASADTIVAGRLRSTPRSTFTIEIFSSVAPDASGYGEGTTFIGSTDVTTDTSGETTFAVAAAAPVGSVLTATATGSDGTSEFSNAVTVTAAGTVQFATDAITIAETATRVAIMVTRTSAVGAATVQYSTVAGTAVAGADYLAVSGVLTFEHGQSSATLFVTIEDDSLDEPEEEFSIVLSDPTGVSLGEPQTTIVHVADDEAAVLDVPLASSTALLLLALSVAFCAVVLLRQP